MQSDTIEFAIAPSGGENMANPRASTIVMLRSHSL
jgi:hypothetical protein